MHDDERGQVFRLFLDDLRTVEMVYPDADPADFVIVRNYEDFVSSILLRGRPDFISFDNDLGLGRDGEVAPDGYAAARWLVYDSGLDLRGLRFHVHSANPVAADQIRGLLDHYLRHLEGE